uniref:Movement protein n=1 Tax=Sweet potato symptomless virus 1 TaxID=603333 RepID=A0A2U8ZTU8_9GEMI|nr:movement protein [Sweet potato symptomless virus 1]
MNSSVPIFDPFPVYSPTNPKSSSDSRLDSLITVIVVTLLFVGIVYLAYVLFLKDVILLLKAKRQRTTTEIGFGQTPRVNTQGGGVG